MKKIVMMLGVALILGGCTSSLDMEGTDLSATVIDAEAAMTPELGCESPEANDCLGGCAGAGDCLAGGECGGEVSPAGCTAGQEKPSCGCGKK